jgi:hypothetical protein
VISRAELEEISRSYKRTADFDPEILNTRPSLGVGHHSTGDAPYIAGERRVIGWHNNSPCTAEKCIYCVRSGVYAYALRMEGEEQ